MKKSFKEISGSIVAPQGFLASGVFCDIKRLGTGKGSDKGKSATSRSSCPKCRRPSPACSPPTRFAPRR
jgi:hypothetical protein